MKLLFGVDDEENFRLLTNLFVVAMDTQGKQMEVVDWTEWKSSSLNLARKYTANEIIFAEYCEIHACRKCEMKSGYQRWYRVNRVAS